jgi:hypothetical protein
VASPESAPAIAAQSLHSATPKQREFPIASHADNRGVRLYLEIYFISDDPHTCRIVNSLGEME